jgi:hypothetical protein
VVLYEKTDNSIRDTLPSLERGSHALTRKLESCDLELLVQCFHKTGIKLGGLRPWEGDLFDEVLGQYLDECAVSVRVELWHVENLCVVEVLCAVDIDG